MVVVWICVVGEKDKSGVTARLLAYSTGRMELTFTELGKTLRGSMRGNIRSIILNLRLKWLLDIHKMLEREQVFRIWSFMVMAWAPKAMILEVISLLIILKAMSLDDVTKIV